MGKIATKQNRQQAIEETVDRHRGRLTSLVRSLLHDRADAEDVLQETFEEYIEAYDLGETFEAVSAWLARVARNKVLDRFRRKKTQSDYVFLVNARGENDEASSDPDSEWQRERFRAAIQEALETLPREQREVFVMHELEGKSFQEIAAATGVGVNTLLSRKRYAVLALREYLKEVYDELE